MIFSDDLFEPKENKTIYNYLKPKYIKTNLKVWVLIGSKNSFDNHGNCQIDSSFFLLKF